MRWSLTASILFVIGHGLETSGSSFSKLILPLEIKKHQSKSSKRSALLDKGQETAPKWLRGTLVGPWRLHNLLIMASKNFKSSGSSLPDLLLAFAPKGHPSEWSDGPKMAINEQKRAEREVSRNLLLYIKTVS